MADRKGGSPADNIMSPAEMKPLLMMSKREPVNAVIGMTKDHDGIILLSKRIKPKKLLAQVKADARKSKIELDLTSLRFGKAEVDADKDSGLVMFTVNKDAPGALRMKLLELVKRVPYAKVEIDVDAKFEAEPDDDDEQGGASPTAPPQTADATPADGQAGNGSGQGTQQGIPPDATDQGGPLSITKRYDPGNASRDEVVQALTRFLNQELALQGTRELAVTDRVKWAVLKLFADDPVGYGWFDSVSSKAGLPGAPADFAKLVGNQLPDVIPRKNMVHLDVPPKKDPEPTGVVGKGKSILKGKLGEIGKIPEDVRTSNQPAEAPSNQPTTGSSPGQHTISTPDIPAGGTPPKRPNPDLPQAPLARDDDAVKKVIASVNDDELIPAAAKRTELAGNYPSAQELARDIADRLATAEANGKDTVVVPLGPEYRGADDLREIFEKIEGIARKIAAVLPGGVRDVDKVIIRLPRTGGKADKKYPPEWVVKLRDGG